MKLYPPIKEGMFRNYTHNQPINSLADLLHCESQVFGANPQIYSQFGLIGHNGIDLQYEDATPVYASHDGIATTGEDSYKGLGVVVQTNGFKTIYWHFKDFSVSNGQSVKQGDLLGHGDSTGFSTGPHLHFGLKLLDSNGNVLNRDNGYDGAVDPTQYLVWYDQETMTEQEVKQLQALEGYNDPAGVAYWTGKSLQDYLNARLADKIKTIQAVQ